MTLHAAIIKVLQEKMRPVTVREITDILNERKLYAKKDGSVIETSQVAARINNYPKLFKRNGADISLVHWFDTYE